MANRKAKVNDSGQGAILIEQLQQRFIGLWRRLTASEAGEEADPAFVKDYLASLKERAYLERTIANQYRGRYLLELIQNAVDAMHKQTQLRKAKIEPFAYRCHLELTATAFYLANDGQPFDEADVRGLCAMGQSTKPAGEYIGYKGLGFRAVLEICDAPEIYSGLYQFGFSRAETLSLLDSPAAPANLDKAELPILSVPHLRLPEALPTAEQEVLAKLKKAGYATIVRLPLKSLALTRQVREACLPLLNDYTLLFLPYISELSALLPGERINDSASLTSVAKDSRELSIRPDNLAQQVKVSRLTFRKTETEVGAKKNAAPPPETRHDWLLVEPRKPLKIEPPELVARLQDSTWAQVRRANLALAYPLARMPWSGGDFFLKRRPEPVPFFAHFPTQEGSGLGFAVHADFYLSASRKQIEWDVSYNRWLSEKVVNFATGPALEAVHYLYPDEAALIEILVDFAYYNDYFGRAFRDLLDSRLSHTAFIPVGNGNYMPPNRVVWTPLEQDGVLIFRRVFRYPGSDIFYPVLQLEEVYSKTATSPEPEEKAKPKGAPDNSDFFFDLNTDSAPKADYYGSNWATSSTKSDEDTAYNRAYEHDPYSSEYDYDPYSSKYEGDNSRLKKEPEPEFDYQRIRQFLSDLGVRKLDADQLPQIFGQALSAWEIGRVLTSEVCAALALWYTALLQNEPKAARTLLELAQSLPVLPTLTAGWQVPEDRRYLFADELPLPSLERGSADIIPAAPEEGQQELLLIPLEAYDLSEFKPQIKQWHRTLGVREA